MNDIGKFIAEHGYDLKTFIPRYIGLWKKRRVYFVAFRDGSVVWGVPTLVLVHKDHMRMATVEEVDKFEDYMVKQEAREKKRNKKKHHGTPDCAPLTDRTLEEIEAAIREEKEKCRHLTEWPEVD